MNTTPVRDRRAGMASFGEDDDLPLPTAAQIAAAKSSGEGLGFKSERSPPVPEKSRIGGNGRPAVFTANFHIRTKPEDRERFEEFAYRHRLSKGEAMTRLLDLAEVQERAQDGRKND